jgi:hypothetical protein
MTTLLVLTFVMLTWQFWLRQIYFHRRPTLPNKKDTFTIYSPAEGTLVYDTYTYGHQATITKQNDTYKLDYGLEPYELYQHIGIYMTVYDNHYVASGIPGTIVRTGLVGQDNPASMMTFLDNLLAIFGLTFYKWLDRSQTFLTQNQQFFITYDNGIVIVITLDKTVNIITPINEQGLLYFLHKGSQTDIFIPLGLGPRCVQPEGSRVTYTDPIAYMLGT